jgi:hypothetical protein
MTMSDARQLTFTTVNINASEPGALARCYSRLLGWDITAEDPGWVLIRSYSPASNSTGFPNSATAFRVVTGSSAPSA